MSKIASVCLRVVIRYVLRRVIDVSKDESYDSFINLPTGFVIQLISYVLCTYLTIVYRITPIRQRNVRANTNVVEYATAIWVCREVFQQFRYTFQHSNRLFRTALVKADDFNVGHSRLCWNI